MRSDLNEAEFDELDELLEKTPEPLEPLDVLMLEGYLCGVLVQPRLVPVDEWLPPVFDLEGRALPDDVDAAWRARVAELAERRLAALNAALAEDGWFDPIIVDLERAPPASEYDVVQSEHARALLPWLAGFQWAQQCFPELAEVPDDGVATAMARLYRHLPAETDEEREVVAVLDREHPLATLDEATEDLVFAVADLWEITRDARYKVQPVRRDAPKVGRNDPCPCGSGKKFKACHGKG
jgi:uncharacterized protein